jgi:ABC-type antimicrobial peptide transport system permease subunit
MLNSESIPAAIKILVGLLLNSQLLSKQLVFFTDGARDIHSWITKLFPYANYKIILDWYHLCKKCREQLSMIMYGAKARNEFLEKLNPCLWFGNVAGAIKLLKELDNKQIRNQDLLDKLIEYLERVREYIPNYALRKELGLRNSSNMGEKTNDLLVANRQKHNGMSWSNSGSIAFAAVTAASYNGELMRYIYDGSASLQLSLAA